MKLSKVPLAALTACALLAAGTPALTIAQTIEQPRTINVNGRGEVMAEPDCATLTLGVESRKPKLDDARAEVTKTVDAVLKLTRDLKIDPKYVRATRINVQPEYNWDNNARERTLIGYVVSRQVDIELRDLDKLGQLLERAGDLGVNQMGDPQLDSSRRQELQREALAKAVADAQQNAQVVAKAAGARLGPARTISANADQGPIPMPYVRTAMAMDGAAEKAAGTYQRGQMTFTGNVSVQYDLVPAPAQ